MLLRPLLAQADGGGWQASTQCLQRGALGKAWLTMHGAAGNTWSWLPTGTTNKASAHNPSVHERQRRRRAPDAAGAARGIAAIAVGFDRAPRPKTTV